MKIFNTYRKKETLQRNINNINKKNIQLAIRLYGEKSLQHDSIDFLHQHQQRSASENKVAKLDGEKYINGLDIARVKEETKLIEKENDLLKTELQIEELRFKIFKEKENFRYLVYNKRTDLMIQKCNKVVQMAQVQATSK